MASIDHPRLAAPLRIEGGLDVSSSGLSFRVRFEEEHIAVIFQSLGHVLRARKDLADLRSRLPDKRQAATGGTPHLPPVTIHIGRRKIGHLASTPSGPKFRLTPLAFLFG